MSRLSIIFIASLSLSACADCPEEKASPAENDTEDPPPVVDTDDEEEDDDALTAEEIEALDTWTARAVSLSPADGEPSIEGDRVTILLAAGSVESLDLVTALTRAQDHNSSRSNKTG